MPAVIIRNLSKETHAALKQLAALNQRSMEAEIREILVHAAAQSERGLGSALAEIGRRFNITDEFDNLRDPTPAGTVSFG